MAEEAVRNIYRSIIEDYMRAGYKASNPTLTKSHVDIITFYDLAVATEGRVLAIKPPAGQVVVIGGTLHVPKTEEADMVRIKLADSTGEIGDETPIRTELRSSDLGVEPAFAAPYGFLNRISMQDIYRPRNTIEIVGPDELRFIITPEAGLAGTTGSVDDDYCECAIQCTLLKRGGVVR